MSLYPSLEDMKVDQMCKAQIKEWQSFSEAAPPPYNPYNNDAVTTAPAVQNGATVYPSLGEYMGLELSQEIIAQNMPEYSQVALIQQQSVIPAGANTNLIAPISGQSLGLQKAQVTHGIREVILCKDRDNKVGIRVKAINNGVFICLVIDKSPAAMVGLRFGDQILQINDVSVAGMTMEKVHNLFKKSPVNGIKVIVRDRPFERTLTLHKDSTGSLGFQFKNGKVISLIKDSSATRNGMLTEHHLLEVDGQNVVGLKDKQIREIIANAGSVVTVTVIPSFLYEHMIKKMAGSVLRDLMDHTIPTL